MKAVQISRFGGPEVLEVIDLPIPVPAPHEVLVRVRASGVNFAETLMRQNRYALTPELPAVLGHEVAGTIEALGEGVRGLARGARVVAPMFAAGAWFSGYAEYALIDASLVVPLPDALSFEEAPALMVQGLTALELIRRVPPAGKTVLVSAAGGGVGSLLVQLAKRAGAKTVIAAASHAAKLDLAMSLGADAGVDYPQVDWIERAREASGGPGPDIIFESVGGDVTMGSLQALAPLGQLVIYGALNIQRFQLGVPELLGLVFGNQSVTGYALAPLLTPERLKDGLAELFALAVTGRLKVTIGRTFPLEGAAEAHREIEGRRTTGKVVLVP
ncbi:MAG TPA: quinone oxidoreductase [Verrucomicrobiae bacterium]|nr:quinone oxidoreductase [Verrucomicrobiae bacterium]